MIFIVTELVWIRQFKIIESNSQSTLIFKYFNPILSFYTKTSKDIMYANSFLAKFVFSLN